MDTKQARRDNQGKPQLSYILDLDVALDELARVFEYGATRYGRDNWLLGNKDDKEYIDSAFRHLKALKTREEFDEESDCHHAAHLMWNAAAFLVLNRKALLEAKERERAEKRLSSKIKT